MTKKKKPEIIPPKKTQSRKERALYCTQYLQEVEARSNWVALARVLIECDQDELWRETNCDCWDEWVHKFAPTSYRKCMGAKRRFLKLYHDIPIKALVDAKPETAEYISRCVPPAALKSPVILEALPLPPRKAIKLLKAAMPEQHLESIEKTILNQAESQHDAFNDALEAYRFMKNDEGASKENFVEFLISEWMDSVAENNRTIRENWEAHKEEREPTSFVTANLQAEARE
jgi:hypothetical protein